jgi:hypothetical protein
VGRVNRFACAGTRGARNGGIAPVGTGPDRAAHAQADHAIAARGLRADGGIARRAGLAQPVGHAQEGGTVRCRARGSGRTVVGDVAGHARLCRRADGSRVRQKAYDTRPRIEEHVEAKKERRSQADASGGGRCDVECVEPENGR